MDLGQRIAQDDEVHHHEGGEESDTDPPKDDACGGHPYGEARVLHVYGLLQARREEPEPACRRLEVALALCTRLGARLEAERIERVAATLR
jgi:hypothetical protein